MADYGHSKTDEMLKDLESRIYEEYSGASKEIQKQTSKYLKKFETKDAEMLKKLNANEITHKEYLAWRESAMATGKRWEALKDTIDKDLENANQIANAMIRDHAYDVYALNHNYGTYEIENGLQANTSYTLYNHSTVERLVKDNPQMLPPPGKVTSEKIRRGELKRWNNRQVQSVMTQSILAGDSIPEISKKLAMRMGEVSAYSHIRAARTMTTGAQNAGRIDSYMRAEALGLKFKKQWLAAHDSRVRKSHRELDGVSVPLKEDFDNECSYPGDPLGPAAEVYNCRCTLIADFGDDPELGDDFELGDMDFEEWIEAHEEAEQVVQGKDISDTWVRRGDEFDFEIEDVINAQGFDGLPRVVDADEFDALVKEANGGEKFVAQRTYSASSQEILDEYREQLYNGKWYVDCSTGGAQYGQGMYCAADYTGKISKGMTDEMKHYQMLNSDKLGEISQSDLARIVQDQKSRADEVLKQYKAGEISKERGLELYRQINAMEPSEYLATYMKDSGIAGARSYTETVTLDKSARIIESQQIIEEKQRDIDRLKDTIASGMPYSEKKKILDKCDAIFNMDDGVYATLKGYDAINAKGHGLSGSYTIILNRTKVIIRRL